MKRVIALLLSLILVLGCLTACGKKEADTNKGSQQSSSSDSSSTKKDDSSKSSDASSTGREVYTLDIYDAAANYQGLQTGWFQQVVKSRFDIELNIIAPQVAGSDIYQTRTASGNLGDIVILDATDFNDCVGQGLIKDISAEIKNQQYLMEYWGPIDTLNKSITDTGAVYGIPCEMVNTSPTSYSQDVIYSSPLLRWDQYTGVGSPDIKDLDGLLDTLEAIMQKYPTNDAGDPCYPFSLWADWDGGDGMLGIANVVQLTTWYGEKIKGSAILKADNTFTPITDKTASYYKILKFLNTAYRRGLLDPDSGTQDWNSACAKMSAGQVQLMWYSWQVGFWNSTDRINDGTAFIFIPVKDQLYYTDSDAYYGSGRIWGIGSGVTGDKYDRIMEFLNWYASPEGCQFQHDGIEGFNYEIGSDGKYYVKNSNALMDNLPVPEEYGGAGYQDGNNQINQWIVGSSSFNPLTGEQYATQYWATYKESIMCDMKREWAAKFGAAEPVDYMKANNVLLVSPSVSVSLPSDTADISVARNMCNNELCEASWRTIFKPDDASFDAEWDAMVETLNSYNFDDLYKFDVEKHTIELNAKLAAK